MSQLYDKMAEGTLLVVMCQGALTSMVNLAAKRTKSKWDATSKERMDTIAGKKRDRSQSKHPTQPYPHPENLSVSSLYVAFNYMGRTVATHACGNFAIVRVVPLLSAAPLGILS